MEAETKQVCEDLMAFIRTLKAGLADLAEAHDLTPMQLYALYAILGGATTMSSAATALRCDASNVTGIVDRLVAQGLVTRQEDPADRRAKTLELTAAGQHLMDVITAALPDKFGYSKLTASERVALRDIIKKIT